MDYTYFGVMTDCSRNAVLGVPAVKKLIDCLQKMGYNMLELYTEDTYEVAGEPYFGYFRGRYTGKELKELDAYARDHGIELIPCIQTLAHFTAPVKLPRFGEITDCDDILLIDEEKTYEFIDRLFSSLAANFTSRNVHIGMDEAHKVGLGKYLDKHGYQDRFALLNRHLTRVVEIAKKYGFTPHMWGDMFFRLATHGEYYKPDAHIPEEAKQKVPKEVELVFWDYYHTDEKMYDGMIAAHREFGREVWFAGGAWTWTGFAPRTRYTYESMRAAMKSVHRNGVKKVFITMWGDNGGECPPFAQLQTLYAIRRYADGEFDERKIADEFYKLFGVSAADFDLLELPDRVPDVTDPEVMVNPCKATLYTNPFMGLFDEGLKLHEHIPYADYAVRLCEAKQRAGEFAYLFESAQKLCELLDIKTYLGIRTRAAYKKGDKKALEAVMKDYDEAQVRLQAFFDAYAAQWHTVNKPFGFEVQCMRLGGLKQMLAYYRARLADYLDGKCDRIDELEEETLPLNENDPAALAYIGYATNGTMSML